LPADPAHPPRRQESRKLRKTRLPPVSGGRVRGWRCRRPLPSEPYVILTHHTAQAFRSAFRKTRPVPSALLAIVDLSMACTVEQFQVVRGFLSAMTSPASMMDVPRFLAGSQRLATSHTTPLLALPEILDPPSTRKGSFQLPVQPFFQVKFPRWIVRIGCAPDLHEAAHRHPACFHQGDRYPLAVLVR